jgi:hypothetical protein
MGNVDQVDRTLALNEMMYHVRRDAALRRRFVDGLDGLGRAFGLSAAEVEALRDRDVRRPSDLGSGRGHLVRPSMAWRTGTGFVTWPVAASVPAADAKDA